MLVRVAAHPKVIYKNREGPKQAWTHDVEILLGLADIKDARDKDSAANAALYGNWQRVKDWNEKSRYLQKIQLQAQRLFDAITDPNNGVMQWIRAPLVIDEIDAGKEFLKRLEAFRPVIAACWLRRMRTRSATSMWRFDGLTDENTSVAYREVLHVTQEMKDHYMDPFRVKLITQDNPVAKAVMDDTEQKKRASCERLERARRFVQWFLGEAFSQTVSFTV